MSEEVVGLVRLHRFSSIDTKVKHCTRGEWRQSMNKIMTLTMYQTSSSGCVSNTCKMSLKKKTKNLEGCQTHLTVQYFLFLGVNKNIITDQSSKHSNRQLIPI